MLRRIAVYFLFVFVAQPRAAAFRQLNEGVNAAAYLVKAAPAFIRAVKAEHPDALRTRYLRDLCNAGKSVACVVKAVADICFSSGRAYRPHRDSCRVKLFPHLSGFGCGEGGDVLSVNAAQFYVPDMIFAQSAYLSVKVGRRLVGKRAESEVTCHTQHRTFS